MDDADIYVEERGYGPMIQFGMEGCESGRGPGLGRDETNLCMVPVLIIC